MLSHGDLVKKVFVLIETGYIKQAGASLTEDFEYIGPLPEPIRKNQFLNLHQALVSALPDWSYNIRMLQEEDDTVSLRTHITGTHTQELHIPSMGVHSPATGRRIVMPLEPIEVKIRENRIASITVGRVRNGGVMGLLEQIGVELPIPAGAAV
ncbi:MAG: hypothetical protein A2293_14740 [Elusimicrobia bacterium RIFOXYB2_FULL_49_7]|nr:MAG: hypothetical protein A2293_14740 [Elusimicrobia bacterium RIFOXYB2_FULL_49_7]